MATQKAIAANDQKNDGASVLYSNSTDYNDVSFTEVGDGKNQLSAVSNYTQKGISGGTFAFNNNSGVMLGETSQIAGASNDAIRLTGYKSNQDGWRGYQQLDVSSIDALTGVVTYGGLNGSGVLPSGLDGTTGVNADHTLSVIPGELVYQKGSLVPVQADY
jgi:hypothetical protein